MRSPCDVANVLDAVVGNGRILRRPPSMGVSPAEVAALRRSGSDTASMYTSAEVSVERCGAMTAAAAGPVTAHSMPAAVQLLPTASSPPSTSRQSTPRSREGPAGLASAWVRYALRRRSESAICRAELRPRAEEALSNPAAVRICSARVHAPDERPVTAAVSLTVGVVPTSTASATARTAGVQRASSANGFARSPARETTIAPRRISAAPDSSTQPTPRSESRSRAPGERDRETTMPGRA
ncbi:MAG: hypothetical protein JWM47_1659 [Acidimicrobiales bacterium]|nr:hypothetical protein [Acidimicrobiales bacterium]